MLSFWRSLNNFGKAVFLTLTSIVVIFMAEVRADRLLRQGIDMISTPIVGIFSKGTRSLLDVGNFVGSVGKMSEENKLLRARVDQLELDEVAWEEMKVENRELKAQLGLQEETGLSLLAAQVIAKEPVGAVKIITVDQGTEQGVQNKMPVVVSEGLLIGYVEETYASSSRILLITDPSVEIPAMVQNTRTDGLVKGQAFGQGLSMELIPQNAPVERGNTVITSAIGERFPAGLLIGYVQGVYEQPNQVFKRADLLPAADFERLERVLIVLGSN